MKKPISKRAAAIKPEYSPIAAPPNKRADEARAALMEYSRDLLANPPQDDTPPAPALSAALPLVAERLDGSGKWPPLSVDMSTARVERVYHLTPDGWRWCWGVTFEATGTKGNQTWRN